MLLDSKVRRIGSNQINAMIRYQAQQRRRIAALYPPVHFVLTLFRGAPSLLLPLASQLAPPQKRSVMPGVSLLWTSLAGLRCRRKSAVNGALRPFGVIGGSSPQAMFQLRTYP